MREDEERTREIPGASHPVTSQTWSKKERKIYRTKKGNKPQGTDR